MAKSTGRSESLSFLGKGSVPLGGLISSRSTTKVPSCRLTGTEERICKGLLRPASLQYRTNSAVSDIRISDSKLNSANLFRQSTSRAKTVPFGVANKNLNQSMFVSNHTGAIASFRVPQARQFNKTYKDARSIWAVKCWTKDGPDENERQERSSMKTGDHVEVRVSGFAGQEDAVWSKGVVSLSNWDGTGRVNVLLDNGDVYNYLSKAKKEVRYVSRKAALDADKSKQQGKRPVKIQPPKQHKQYHPEWVSFEPSRWDGPMWQKSNYSYFSARSGRIERSDHEGSSSSGRSTRSSNKNRSRSSSSSSSSRRREKAARARPEGTSSRNSNSNSNKSSNQEHSSGSSSSSSGSSGSGSSSSGSSCGCGSSGSSSSGSSSSGSLRAFSFRDAQVEAEAEAGLTNTSSASTSTSRGVPRRLPAPRAVPRTGAWMSASATTDIEAANDAAGSGAGGALAEPKWLVQARRTWS